jgi:hypothetical protein
LEALKVMIREDNEIDYLWKDRLEEIQATRCYDDPEEEIQEEECEITSTDI